LRAPWGSAPNRSGRSRRFPRPPPELPRRRQFPRAALRRTPVQLAGSGGALLALWTGHEEGERFEEAAGPAFEAHVEAATAFTVVAGVTLAVAAAGLALRRGTALTWRDGTDLARRGDDRSHAGGELVFVHRLGGSRAAAVGEREKDAD
jgi:hypothetical protein